MCAGCSVENLPTLGNIFTGSLRDKQQEKVKEKKNESYFLYYFDISFLRSLISCLISIHYDKSMLTASLKTKPQLVFISHQLNFPTSNTVQTAALLGI